MRLIYLALFLFFISCAPKIAKIDYNKLDVDKILIKIKKEKNKINTLQGIARVRAKNNFDSLSIKQVTVLESPYMFRLEALAAFGQSIAVVTSNGEQVVFRTRGEEVVFEDVKKFNLTYFYPGIPREIKSRELIDLLLGKVPFGLWGNDYELSVNEKDNMLRVKYHNSNNTQTVVYLDPVNESVKSAEIELDDNKTVRIDYMDYKNIGDLSFPNKISLNYLSNQINISYEKDLLLNKQVDEGLFLN